MGTHLQVPQPPLDFGFPVLVFFCGTRFSSCMVSYSALAPASVRTVLFRSKDDDWFSILEGNRRKR